MDMDIDMDVDKGITLATARSAAITAASLPGDEFTLMLESGPGYLIVK